MTFSAYEVSPGWRAHSMGIEAIKFPGGEQHVTHTIPGGPTGYYLARLDGADSDELFQLAMWVDMVKRMVRRPRVLMLPYLPGARMDRGEVLGAKVYADFINSLDFDVVVTVDPHSDVAPALYNNLEVVGLEKLAVWSTSFERAFLRGVIAPDVGAAKRAGAVASVLGVPLIQANKKRDFATGKLSGFEVSFPEEHQDNGVADMFGNAKNYLVVDDICDGGGTFMGLADAAGINRRLMLWVTHGIFSGQAFRLKSRYMKIATTDSHPGHNNIDPNTVFNLHLTMQRTIEGVLA